MAKMHKSPYSAEDEQNLMAQLWSDEIRDNPYNFVMFCFPWGQEGTPLANHKGPREWQKEILLDMARHIKENKKRMENGELPQVYRCAVASGRGIGKSALTSWLNLWSMSCVLGGSCVTTANTEQQLKTRTWAELGKWHTLMINSHWFDRTALSFFPHKWYKEALSQDLKVDSQYYYAQAQLWQEDNPDAFAGLHNENGMMIIFDEASGIPQPIWTVTEGFFTDICLHRYYFVFSNPRRNTGAFYECFHKDRANWRRNNIDSRSVAGVDTNALEHIVHKYGEDSDEARVEVKGEFPRQGDSQFISREIIDMAVGREIQKDPYAPLIMGIDVARFGNDTTVFRFRQGRDARSIPAVELKSKDNMEVANQAGYFIDKYDPDAVAIDAGNGTGVIDRLREMGYKVHEVWFGGKPQSEEWANLRTEMWAKMRDWLGGGCIDNHKELIDDLAGPEYKFRGSSDKIMLETKEEMKKRGIASPDHGDALACTFAIRVARRDRRAARGNERRRAMAKNVDYDIFG